MANASEYFCDVKGCADLYEIEYTSRPCDIHCCLLDKFIPE